MARRALILVHESDNGAGQIEARLVERGLEVDHHLVTPDRDAPGDASPCPSVAGYDLLVPMGSIRSLTDKTLISSWIHDELRLIRDVHEAGTPILGICFGVQLIAEALGGSVETAPVTEIGWYRVSDGPDGPNPAGPGPWMAWHHDRITAPPDAEVLATTPDAIQLIKAGTTVGTQFHPEVDAAHVAGWLANTSDDYLAEYGVTREQMLADARAHEAGNIAQCHAFVDWFLDEVAFPTS